MSDYKPKVLVDFDGVIHRYRHGWMDGTAYDSPMDDAREALDVMDGAGYEIVIFSTRDAEQITEWLVGNGFPPYRVTNVKEAAVAQIDDRAIRFVNWRDAIQQLFSLYPVRQEPLTPEQLKEMEAKFCPTCQGTNRQTSNMVCQTCGRDYMKDFPRPTKLF
jgi:hypothetical protein